MSWCRAPPGSQDRMFNTLWRLLSCHCGAPSLRSGNKNLVMALDGGPEPELKTILGYNWTTLFLRDTNTGTWYPRLGESQMRVQYMIMSPVLLVPVSDCTAYYRPVLSSERAPYMKKPLTVRKKKIKIWSCAPKGSSTPWRTDALPLAAKSTSKTVRWKKTEDLIPSVQAG
jgi:hypothetical protein